MLQKWEKDGKSGNVVFPKGEVVYQTRGVVIEPVYKTDDDRYYIEETEENLAEIDGEQYIKVTGRQFIEKDGQRFAAVSSGKLLEVLYNPFNGYLYRQDGK